MSEATPVCGIVSGQMNRFGVKSMETKTDKPWHQLPAEEVIESLGVNLSTGLSADEVEALAETFIPLVKQAEADLEHMAGSLSKPAGPKVSAVVSDEKPFEVTCARRAGTRAWVHRTQVNPPEISRPTHPTIMITILIAYDGSECSEAIIDELHRAGLPSQVEAHVVSVAEVWTAPADPAASAVLPAMVPADPSAQIAVTLAKQYASALAGQGAARLRAAFPQWRVEFMGSVGSPASAIVKQAREVSADVIFIGSHSRSAIGRFFLGSVSQKVAAEAKCSVRICRPRAAPGAALRLLVAVDGSPPSQAAVGAVAGRAWPAGTVVAAVAVIEPALRAVEGSGEPSAEWLCQRDRMLVWLEAVNTAAHRQLELAGLVPESHVLEGEPKPRLLEWAESWNADCLFIGASGLQHPATETLGTVASALAVRAHCSVEIVRL